MNTAAALNVLKRRPHRADLKIDLKMRQPGQALRAEPENLPLPLFAEEG
jgi:hypothetical protein